MARFRTEKQSNRKGIQTILNLKEGVGAIAKTCFPFCLVKEKLGGEGGAKTEKKDEIGKKRKGGTWLFPFCLSRLAFREREPFLFYNSRDDTAPGD